MTRAQTSRYTSSSRGSRYSPSRYARSRYPSRAASYQSYRQSAAKAASFESYRRTDQAGPTRNVGSIVGASLFGYRASGINSQKFGRYNIHTKGWDSGYKLDQYRSVRTAGRVNPSYTSMMGSQSQHMSARQSGGIRGVEFEVEVEHTSRKADYLRKDVYTEVKMGGSFSKDQLEDYVKSKQKTHYDFRTSPLSNSARRQRSNLARVQSKAANSGGRITVSQAQGPRRAHVRAMQTASFANTALRRASRLAVPVAIGLDAYAIGRSYRADGGRIGTQTKETLFSVGGSWAGAAAGGVAGAKAGAVVGTFIGGPVGTAVGGVVGGVAGAAGGAIAGSSIGKSIYGWFFGRRQSKTQSFSRRTSTRTNSLSRGVSVASVSQTKAPQHKRGWGGFFGLG